MKKISVAACVCIVLFSFGIHGEGIRAVSAKTPGAEENLAILQDIIRENELFDFRGKMEFSGND